jgi:hypothetical protein
MGTWQFITATGRNHGLRKDRMMDERRDFERATEAAIQYLKGLKAEFGTWALAMAAYNCGEARVRRVIKEQKVRDYYQLNLPLETERYIFRIAAAKIIMGNPEKYGYRLDPARIYDPVDCDPVKVKVLRPVHITDVARTLGTNFKTLKELNPQFRGPYLPRGSYRLKVPAGLGPKVAAALKGAAPRRRGSAEGTYRVQPGDTLIGISKRTGVSLSMLRRLNRIEGSLIKIGQELRLEP